MASFDGVTCTYTKCTGHELGKMEVCVLANFSKTFERNKTLFTGIQAKFNQQNSSKIGSCYEEIFQHKGTVPKDKIAQVRLMFR